jgi:hypothetical protein
MMNEEIMDILFVLKNIGPEFYVYAEKIEDYINNLQKKAELAEHYKHLYSEVKKQKDDVVEYIKNNKYKQYAGRNEFTCEIQYSDYVIKVDDLLRMLGEIDVED